MKPTWRRVLFLLTVMSALVAAGCGGEDDADDAATPADPAAPAATEPAEAEGPAGERPRVAIGTKNFTEQYVLGELYRQALEARGYEVELKSDIGSTEIIDAALTSGEIDMYPEYTGTALTVVFGEEGSADTAEATYERARERYEERGQTLLAMTAFSNADAIAVRRETAEEHGLETVGDLASLPSLRLGGQPEFRTRTQGLPGLEQNYGLTGIEFVPLAGISPYEALDQERVDAAAIFATDPPLASGDYVVLADTEAQFGFQNVAPVVRQDLLEAAGEDFVETVDAVTALLTEEAIIAMNSAVAIDQRPAAEVARQFLEANGLL
jgi:osmoprotectant transport system substrate-binding protein